jgi:hypothetical protein
VVLGARGLCSRARIIAPAAAGDQHEGGDKPVAPGDFLPRRVMGEYLHWYYRTLVAHLPPGVRVRHHATAALDITPGPDGGETIALGAGGLLSVDHAILTFGHVANRPPSSGQSMHPPYALGEDARLAGAASTVAICGMGLVATDVVLMLTQGRGGRFEQHGERLRYLPSGREPSLRLVSRSGLPYRAKSTRVSQVPGRQQGFVFNTEAIAALRARGPAAIDFRAEVLPLLYREMSVRYHLQALQEAGDGAAAERWAGRLRGLRRLCDVDDAIATLACGAAPAGPFDPAALFHGEAPDCASAQAYQRHFCASIGADLAPSERSGPLNAACETLRVLRDGLRAVVEDGRLTLASSRDFHGRLRNDINRLVAGPPDWRLRQLLALADAGVLRVPYGPAPRIEPAGGRWRIASTRLAEPHAEEVDLLVRGYLEDPRMDASASPLLDALYRAGRLNPWRYDDADKSSVGSVAMDADEHPLDRDGRAQPRLWLFGALTEGARFFTHYIPSPSRGTRAYRDIDRCVAAMLGWGGQS